jgi:hypothetical protein
MESQVARPVSYFVFTQRHLSFGKVIRVNSDDFSHVPRSPDPYWEPPIEGTLVKSSSDPAVYVIENGTRELLSYEVFVKRNYSFANIRSLPQAEIDVIAPGTQAL